MKIQMLTKRHFLLGTLAISAACLSSPSYAHDISTPKKALIIVSLADNANQGIVPTTSELGNGQNARTNLYWGALYGVKTYFKRSDDYTVSPAQYKSKAKGVLDHISITPNDHSNISIDALAIDGRFQQVALTLYHAALAHNENNYDLVVYVGHNPLMDINPTFKPIESSSSDKIIPKAVVLACQSRSYFEDFVTDRNATPYVLTNGNMAPEAYSLDGILKAWMNDEPTSAARNRAAQKYAQYQKIPLKNANWLFR